ncbi:MAG: hypothetical protein ACTSUE_22710 [Promethearchaeota archaeon]
MGSKIHSLFEFRPCSTGDLKGSVVAIDGCNWLHQFLKVNVYSKGHKERLVLLDKTHRMINHLRGFLFRTINLVKRNIWPVFVFDGAASKKVRGKKVVDTSEFREKHGYLKQLHDEAVDHGMVELARNLGMRFEYLFPIAMAETKSLIKFMGMPIITAPGEGEAQCAHLFIDGLVDHVLTLDIDALLFGAGSVVKNLSVTRNKKQVMKASLKKSLRALGITREQLVEVAILVGTDFNKGITGIGSKTALRLVKKHEMIEDIAFHENKFDFSALGLEKRNTIQSSDLLDDLRDIFLDPVVRTDITELEWKTPNPTMLRRILTEEHSFSGPITERAILKLQQLVR